MTNHKIVPIDVIIFEIEKNRREDNLLQLELPLPSCPSPSKEETQPSNSEVTIISIYEETPSEPDGCVIFSLI